MARQGKKDQHLRDQIAVRIKMGDKPADIAREMDVSAATVYDVRRKDLGISGHVDMANPAEPAAATAKIGVKMTEHDMAQFTGQDEAMVLAGLYTTEALNVSLKARMLRAICLNGPFEDVRALMNFIRSGPGDTFGSHEVTHILKDSLGGKGLIRYTESRNRGATGRGSVPTNIRATDAGFREMGINPHPAKSADVRPGHLVSQSSRRAHAVGRDMTEKNNHPLIATGGPITVTRVVDVPPAPPVPLVVPPAPTPPAQAYPLLEALRESFEKRAQADALASRYADAAAMLEKDDPEEAERLLAKAVAASPQTLTPLEREYLQFAKDHESRA